MLEIQTAWNGTSQRVLSRDTVRAMLAPQITATQGLGWRLAGHGRSARFEHSGDTAGFECAVVGYLRRGEGAAVMTNGAQGGNLASEIMRAIAKEYGWPDYLPEEKKVVALPEDVLAHHTGRYALYVAPDVSIEISVHQDSLFATLVQPSGTERVPLFAESRDRFFDQESGVEITFESKGVEHARCVVIRQGDEEYRATLVP